MKTTLLLLACLSALAQSLQAQTIIPVPVTLTNGQFIAYWCSPSWIPRTNTAPIQPVATIWIAEVSTDGVSWAQRSDGIYLLPRAARTLSEEQHSLCLTCVHFVEVNNPTDHVRIRLVAY
jgi:hypothetical protein